MKRKKILCMPRLLKTAVLSAAFVATAACTEDLLPHRYQGAPIQLKASTEAPATRSEANIQSASFDAGETINAYIVGLKSDSVTYVTIDHGPTTYTTGAAQGSINPLTPTVQPYYPDGDNAVETIDIRALYPPRVNSDNTTFTVEQVQTTTAQYKTSDLMYAEVIGQPMTDKTITLPFSHKMAKLTVRLTGEENVKIGRCIVRNVFRKVDFDPTTGIVGTELSDSTGGIVVFDSTTPVASATSSVLFPPQTLLANADNFLEVYTDKGLARFILATEKDFEAGHDYTVNLTIGRQNLQNTAAITDWSSASGVMTHLTILKTGLYIDRIVPNEFVYTGRELIPDSVIVLYGQEGDTLTLGDDYELQYYNNTKVGTGLIVCVGKDLYVGSSDIKNFLIAQRPCTMHFQSENVEMTYERNLHFTNPLLEPGDGTFTWTSTNTSVARVDGTGQVSVLSDGTTVIRAAMDGNGNYEAKTVEYTLNITKRSFDNTEIVFLDDDGEQVSLEDYYVEYTGKQIKPAVEVYDGGIAPQYRLTEGYDYTVSYSNNVNVGTASVVVTGMGKYNSDSSKNFDFEISQAQAVISMTARDREIGVSQTYDCKATSNFGSVTYAITSGDASVAEVSKTGRVTAKALGTVTVTASVADDPNGNWAAAAPVSFQMKVIDVLKRFTEPGYVTYTCAATGIYTVELIGGAGGCYKKGTGGRGGIVTASCKLTAGTVIHVYVGGGGTTGENSSAAGGYNGGGASGSSGGGSGGGATDIRIGGTATGNRVLVAGGGGGASGRYMTGKDGGASSSGNNSGADGENADVGGGGGAGYHGGHKGNIYSGGYGGSNYVDPTWEEKTNRISTNGPRNGTDTNVYNGSATITYEFEYEYDE